MSLLCNRRRRFFCVMGHAPEFSDWISLLCDRRWLAFLLYGRRYFVMQFIKVHWIKSSSHMVKELDMITILGAIGHSIEDCWAFKENMQDLLDVKAINFRPASQI